MADIEKVIKGLELCTNISPDGCLMLCPYKDEKDETYSGFCEQVLKHDALALLKEQKKATVISIHRNGFGSRVGACPNCQGVLHYEYNQSFCGKCGQAVKWE